MGAEDPVIEVAYLDVGHRDISASCLSVDPTPPWGQCRTPFRAGLCRHPPYARLPSTREACSCRRLPPSAPRAHSRPFTGELVRLGLGGNTKRDCVVVRITTDDGHVGWGEAHHGQNPTAMAEVVEKGLGSLILGADALDSEGIWARLARQQVVTHGLGAGSVIALSGIDLALWDLKGKVMGQPVYRLLGGSRRRIRAYAGGLSLGFKPVEELEREVRVLVDQGYSAIKLRVGDHPRRDAERVGHIRKTFGDGLDIAVDAATRYTPLDLPEVLAYCEKYRVYWLEEPFTPDNVRAYADLAREPRSRSRAARTTIPAKPSATCSRPARSRSPRPTAPRPAASARSGRFATWQALGTSGARRTRATP